MIDYYLYIPKENINVDMYTNIYLTVNGAKELDTTGDEYSELVGKVEDGLEAISEERQEARYNQFYDSANSKIQDAQKELDEEKEKAEKELNDAEKELEDAQKEVDDGKAEIATNRANANSRFASAESQIEDAKEQLAQSEKEFETKKKQAEEEIANYEEQITTLEQTKEQLDTAESSLSTLQDSVKGLETQLANAATEEQKTQIQVQINELNTQIATIEATIATVETELQNQGVTDIDATITQIKTGIQTAREELNNGEEQIEDARQEIASNEKSLSSTKSSTYAQLNQAEKEIEVLDAKEELKKIERPEWYVLDREQNTGYASYVQDTERVANLAQVFPVVFFLVAALMSLNSMSRMVEEERVQIGTLKALGYNKMQISRKYLIYASLATLVGGGIGLIIGFSYLPKVIADIYAMVYDVPEVMLEFNVGYATAGIAAAILCTVGATIYTCAKILRHNPATLMRPKAPKPGKRVLLEKIPFIWKHMNFTAKVTARNLFRYKKRFMMTIIGVCGCTALIIAGFGLRDAIANMIPKQYGEIDKYDINISLQEEKSEEELQQLEEEFLTNENITETMGANIQSVKIIKDDNNQNIQLIVPEDVNQLDSFIALKDRRNDDEKYVLDNNGTIITEKLARLLDINVGDTITIENADGDRREVTVVHITENYIMHYLYMSPELYNTIFDTKIESNAILAKTNEMTEEQENSLGETLLQDEDNISGVTFISSTADIFEEVMENMDMVVWILIIAAGLLALVVLYNLLNANISERIRELATIKVLGFYDREVYSYIGRETVILTILGILVGLVGGYFLTMYILKTCEIDMLMFDPEIKAMSYVLGAVITIFFAIIVNIVTYFSLKKIDMIESLKSVE